MTQIIKDVDFSDFYLTLIRVLKIIEVFKEKEKFLLTKKRIAMFDYYMRFQFMTGEERQKENFDEKYAIYFWKPNYSLYGAVLAVLISKGLVSCKEGIYHIEKNGEEAILNMKCNYMEKLSSAGQYVLNTVTKMTEKGIEEDIVNKSGYKWGGTL